MKFMWLKTKLGVCLFVCLSVVGPVSAQTDLQTRIKAFEEFARAQVAQDPIPGLSIGFIKDDFTWAAGFGFSDLENQVPAKAESAYRLASVTKPMTAFAVLKLAEAGKLDLDAEVQTYVPYFPRKKWPVTVRALLGHLGGISHYRDYSKEGHFKRHMDTREAIAVFENFELEAEPWSRFNYSSYGYNLLGAVIESASGKPYGQYMREALWGPLGMDATRLDDPDALIPNRVRGYRPGPDGSAINSEFIDISSRFAAGGTRSTVPDLLKFARGILQGRVLPPERLDEMFTPMSTSGGESTGYGMGWGITSVNGRFAVAHSGAQQETSTNLIIFPTLNFAIAFACNFEGGQRAPYVEALYRLVQDEAYPAPAYTGSRETDAVYHAMSQALEWGGSHYDRYRSPLNEDKLDAAFEYFLDCVDSAKLETDFAAQRQKIDSGRHPRAGRPMVALGSYMALQIERQLGTEALEKAHAQGPVEFFSAYLQAADRAGLPDRRRFSRPFARMVAQWREDWNRTWTARVWDLATLPPKEFGAEAAKLKDAFLGKRIYPNLMSRFDESVEAAHLGGAVGKADDWATTAVELYPELDQANLLAGLTALAEGRSPRASELIAKASRINPRGAASPGALNGWAYRFKGLGQAETGLGLLQIAVTLYPREANLYDSVAEFHLAAGRRDLAIEWYRKALEIDPQFENAKKMLEKILAGAQR